MFEVRHARRLFARAPLAFFVALLFTLVLALPLYLLKIEIVPREAAWLPSLLFVVSIFPARLLTGWALARAQRSAHAAALAIGAGRAGWRWCRSCWSTC